MRIFIFIIFIITTISCSQDNEFFDKEQRERIRQYEPNILFINYKILECDKHILLRETVNHSIDNSFESKHDVKLDFLKGSSISLVDTEYDILEKHELISLVDQEKNDGPLKFTLNDQNLSFPNVQTIVASNVDELQTIKVGSVVKWEAGIEGDSMLIALKPGGKLCGKKGSRGQTYSTKPKLVPDTGEYKINADDLSRFDPNIEILILLKRGLNIQHDFIDPNNKDLNICISSISLTNITSTIESITD